MEKRKINWSLKRKFMNRKKSISIMLFIFLFSLWGCGQKADPLNVPNDENITSIEVKYEGQTSTYDDPAFIDEFVSVLLDTEPTARKSVNDSPNAENAIFVSVFCGNVDDYTGFFVYTSGDKTYVEIPYEGIWEAPPSLYFAATTGTFED